MRDAGAHARSPLRASQAGLRSQAVRQISEQLRAESAARNTPDIARFIGYGILLLAALLIAVGAVTA
jgi:hypothetical protein